MHVKVKRADKVKLTVMGSLYLHKELVITRFSCLGGGIAAFFSFSKAFLCDLE